MSNSGSAVHQVSRETVIGCVKNHCIRKTILSEDGPPSIIVLSKFDYIIVIEVIYFTIGHYNYS